MLPGTRTFTDEDIVSVVGEALAVFYAIETEHGIPDYLRPQVFGICHNMVGNRQLAADASIFAGLPEIKGGKH